MIEKINLKFTKIDNEDDKAQAIAELNQLILTPGWQFLKRVIEENIADKERDILDDINSKEVLYNEDDRQKDQRRFLMKLVKMPEIQIGLLTGEAVEDDYDPYFKTADEIKNS